MTEIDTGDTAWVLMSTALVMLMTPGLALFFGGLVRSKNILGTIMQSFFMLGVVTIVFILVGYSLAFGPDHYGLIGDFSWIGLKDVSSSEPGPYAATIPHQTFRYSRPLGSIVATRSPGWTPRSRSAPATRAAAWASSA